MISTNVGNSSVANTNVADTTVLRGGGYPVAAAPGTPATTGAGAVGAPAAPIRRGYGTAWATLPCAASSMTVNEVTYYQCGSTWFTRSFVDGNLAYVVTNPPG